MHVNLAWATHGTFSHLLISLCFWSFLCQWKRLQRKDFPASISISHSVGILIPSLELALISSLYLHMFFKTFQISKRETIYIFFFCLWCFCCCDIVCSLLVLVLLLVATRLFLWTSWSIWSSWTWWFPAILITLSLRFYVFWFSGQENKFYYWWNEQVSYYISKLYMFHVVICLCRT